MESAAHWPIWAVALQESVFGLGIRHSTWIYPTANILHVIGIALLVGSIIALDLRLLGFGRKNIPAAAASRFLTPIAVVGILLIVPSGLTLFTADAGPLAANRVLQVKLVLVALGLLNAILFRLLWERRLPRWDRERPGLGIVQVLASMAIWLCVPVLGRLIAYL
jgi:hypothetical protein